MIWEAKSVEVLEFRWRGWRAKSRKVGVHRRKAPTTYMGERTYESPRLVLPTEFADLVGKDYVPVRARVRISGENFRGSPEQLELDAVVLLILD